MKIQTRCNSRGNTLVLALILLAIIGIDLASYLTLVRSMNRANVRSASWNASLVFAESGVEEALAHLNKNGTNGLGTQGWSNSGSSYWISRTFGDGSYTVSIEGSTNSPQIDSQGFATLSTLVAAAPGPMFAAVGVPAPSPSPTYVSRKIRIRTINAALLAKSLVAKTGIDLKGNNVYSDSFDSTNPLYSTNGLYYPSWARDNGDMATNTGITNSIAGGNATIYGRVATGPGGSVDLGPSGVVGTKAWIDTGNLGIQSGRFTDDMNVAFPDVDPPFSTAPAPDYNVVVPSPGGPPTKYTIVAGTGNFMMTSASLSGNDNILVNGDAVLYVTGDFSMTGQSTLTIAPGARLKLYAGGNVSLTGLGIYNLSGNALNCQFYALPSCTAWKMSGNPSFTGVLYAPNADFTSTGNSIYYGAVVCRTAKFTGNASFHYDEALSRIGPNRGYVPIDWREL